MTRKTKADGQEMLEELERARSGVHTEEWKARVKMLMEQQTKPHPDQDRRYTPPDGERSGEVITPETTQKQQKSMTRNMVGIGWVFRSERLTFHAGVRSGMFGMRARRG